MDKKIVSNQYLQFRNQVLNCTNENLNLMLDNEEQVYIAVFDIPIDSIVHGCSMTLALVFGLNTHVYFSNGEVITGLEKNKDVMFAMQSLFISSVQVLNQMELVESYDYYESEYVRAYLKTSKGVFFKEMKGNTKEERFLIMLKDNILRAITK